MLIFVCRRDIAVDVIHHDDHLGQHLRSESSRSVQRSARCAQVDLAFDLALDGQGPHLHSTHPDDDRLPDVDHVLSHPDLSLPVLLLTGCLVDARRPCEIKCRGMDLVVTSPCRSRTQIGPPWPIAPTRLTQPGN